MALKDIIVDSYSALSHKAVLGEARDTADNSLAPTWVPADQRRRLDAYKILAAYLNNIARQFLPASVTDDDKKKRREYGDPDLLVDRIMAGVLGGSIEIVVDGADTDLPDEPDLPPAPDQPAADASDLDKRIAAARTALWTERATAIVDEWEADWAAQPGLQARQEWLRQWADDELVAAKIVETERDIIGLGDGVYVLSWSSAKQRPVVDIYDPGLYFPVLTDATRDYPERVHLAWEFEGPDRASYVRRLTWSLEPIRPLTDPFTGDLLADDTGGLVFPDDVTIQPDGTVTRDYPWNVDDQGAPVPSSVACYFTDATWRYDQLGGRHADDFDEAKATFSVNEDGDTARHLDLGVDFLPVVHVPNTPAHREHFGRSVLTVVAQILDDLAALDTDVQAASALAAGPVIHLAGAALPPGRTRGETDDPTGRHFTPTATSARSNQQAPQIEARPGTVLRTGENGKMDVLDMSKGLAELRNVRGEQLDRFSINSRVPAEMMGRGKPGDLTATEVLVRFGPYVQLVNTLRMTREPKGRLLLKFAQRLAQIGGVLEPGANPPARFAFGAFLPSDRKQLVDEVTALLGAKGGRAAISTQTAVALLVSGGFDIDDAHGEVQRIRYEHPEAAKALADATGSEQLAAEFLGVTLDPPAPPQPKPTPVLPPTPPPPAV